MDQGYVISIFKGLVMKILFLATYGDFLSTFELSNIKLCISLGYEVHCASDFESAQYNLKTAKLDRLGVVKHQVKFSRSPFDLQNLQSLKELIRLIRAEEIEVVDCHNAVIGAFARIASQLCHVKYVIYTAHGFFFYKGSSLKKQLLFKPIESFFARWTDLLITINQEDYKAASKMKTRGRALYVPGVGIDTEMIKHADRHTAQYIAEFGLSEHARIFLNVGELITRKNQETAIKAFAKANIRNSYLLICGIGQEQSSLMKLIEDLHLEKRVLLLGYRNDIVNLMKLADVFVFPSFQEGLPVALMEAMASGLPCICSDIRGNDDLISDGEGGWLFNPVDSKKLAELMQKTTTANLEEMGKKNQRKIKQFDSENVRNIMSSQYKAIRSGLSARR